MSHGRAKSTAKRVGRNAPRKYCPFKNTKVTGTEVYVVTCVMVVDGRVIVVVDNSGVPENSVTVLSAASQKLGSGAPTGGVLVMVVVPGESQKLGAGAPGSVDTAVVGCGF